MDSDLAMWKHIRGKVKKQYRKLTDDDLLCTRLAGLYSLVRVLPGLSRKAA